MGNLTNQYVSQSFQGLLKLDNSNTGVTSTLQYVTDGLGNKIPMQASTSSIVISGSFYGDGSNLTGITSNVNTGSLVTTSSFNAYTSSNDSKVNALMAATNSYITNAQTSSMTVLSASFATNSNSASYSSFAVSSSYATNAGAAISSSFATNAISSSHAINSDSSISSSFAQNAVSASQAQNSVSASQAQNAVSSSQAQNAISASQATNSNNATSASHALFANNAGQLNGTGSGVFATTGSNIFQGTQTITGSLGITGEITALSASITYLKTIYQTSSVIFTSGSNILGDEASDTQTLFGAVILPTGPLVVTGSVTSTGGFNGNLTGTASYATNALSASQAQNATSSSFAISASFASNALSSSHSVNADIAISSSYATNALSASYATNAATASIANDLIVVGKNNNASTLTRGTIVRIVGANGDNPLFDTASWEDDANSANTLGMLSEDVAPNGFANVVVQGKVIGINTIGMSAGALLFLSSSGQYTTSSIPAPYHEVRLGQVLRNNTNNGSAYITIDNGYELSELHDVDITSPVVGDLLVYTSGSYGQWVNLTGPELGFATTSSVNQKLDTGSFNTYTASMDARTGSYATTGSNIFKGDQTISGSLIGSVNNDGLIKLFSEAYNSGSVKLNVTSSNAISQSNIFFGGVAGPAVATQTGSIVISGSNNIFMGGPRPSTIAQGTYGYINGNFNIMTSPQTLNTASIYRPSTNNNFVNSNVSLAFTSGSLTAPSLSNNGIYSTLTVAHQSASINYTQNVNLGTVTSTANNINLPFLTTIQGNLLGAASHTFSHISSSITMTNNIIGGGAFTATNLVSSSVSATANGLSLNNNIIGGNAFGVWVSGSNSTARRAITGNLLGGGSSAVTASQVGSDNANLLNSLVWGQNLIVSGTHSTSVGGSTFVGRYNDTTSLHLAQDVVFAVGTGTGTSARRTGLYVTSGSLVGVSGSLDVKGNSTLTGSVNITGALTVLGAKTILSGSNGDGVALYVSGTIQTQRLQFDGNPFNSNVASNLGALRLDSNNAAFIVSNYNKAETTSGSFSELYVSTGSNYVHSRQTADYANTSASTTLANANGTRTYTVIADNSVFTGSVQGAVNPLTVAASTASLNLNTGNFFELALTGSQDIHINPSNIKPGQTISIKLNTATAGTVSFPSSVKQASGSAYVPTSAAGVDVITLVSFDSSNLYLANIKNFI